MLQCTMAGARVNPRIAPDPCCIAQSAIDAWTIARDPCPHATCDTMPRPTAHGPRVTYAKQSIKQQGPRTTVKLEPDACHRGRPMLGA